ncbi:MATE family efflux transporter [[Empedobacter] haloabium]|uniref:Multidrug export protein MepA n=1 Tax=[Empedobacter] haloabium TaxID=592317 RepID=A0ABZ1UNU7_9BURK
MNAPANPFLSKPIGRLYLQTGLPIVVVLLINGLYNVINAWFLGNYVDKQALAAVTLVFPLQLALFAMATLVASGMASVLARRFGARDIAGASQAFTSALVLVLIIMALVNLGFALGGDALIARICGDLPHVNALATSYISLLVYCAPILGLLVVNTDALRSEGKIQFMSSCMLASALLNVLLDYVLIVRLHQGVAAAALATVLSQSASLSAIVLFRLRGKSSLRLHFGGLTVLKRHAAEMLPLGVPMSLSHVGVAIQVGMVNYALKNWAWVDYPTLVGAYGIVTRLMTLAIMPLIGLNVAFQTILGNNFGAGIKARVDATVSVGLKIAVAYCATVTLLFVLAAGALGAGFVDDAAMAAQVARLTRIVVAGFVLFGAAMIIGSYFQAIGKPKYAILLSTAKNYLIIVPLLLLMPAAIGEPGIWYAFPLSDILTALLALAVLNRNASRSGARLGLYSNV